MRHKSGLAGTSRNIISHVWAARRSRRTLLSTLVSLSLFLWPQLALAQDPADTLCLNALYRVVYRDSVTNGRALTDDFEKEYSLFSQARPVMILGRDAVCNALTLRVLSEFQ